MSALALRFGPGLLACGAILVSAPASATYSVSAVDTATRQVGGSGTSCIDGASVYRIYGSAPGIGVLNSQARTSTTGRDDAIELLEQGMAPEAIIAWLTDLDYDPEAERRQYGIVDLEGRAAAHSGSLNGVYSGDLQGTAGSFVFSVQGNILTGPSVLSQARDAFVDGGGCDLAERLMLALEGGAQNGEGDSRCTPDGIPSDAAYIQVDLPDEPSGEYLRLEVSNEAPDNPLVALREAFDDWRSSHPCPPVLPDAGASGGAAATGGASTGGAATGGASNAGAPGAGAGSGGTAPAADEAGGCGCRAVSSGAPGPTLILPTLILMVATWLGLCRRRRREQIRSACRR